MTVTIMPADDIERADDNPDLLQFAYAMGASRYARMMAIYFLKDALEKTAKEGHEELYQVFAQRGGTSPEALKTDIRWASRIVQEDLANALKREGVSETDWAERISLGHLRVVVRPGALTAASSVRPS